ncbi:MAG: AraC family transcriptional regulator [Oscillospiraceae bacterium]|nr:AraC family transcriptional regulator [Oscillospiraceae bacterium]
MEYEALTLCEELKIDSIVTIHYFEFCSDYAYHGEKHPFWELLYVDKGEVEITAGPRKFNLKKGEIVFHKPDEFHSIKANGVVAPNLVIFSFYSQSAAMRFFEERVMTVGDTGRVLMGRIVNEAQAAFKTPLNDIETKRLERDPDAPFAAEQIVKLSLESLLIELVRQGPDAPQARPTSLIKGKSQQEFIDKVSKYLEANVDKRLTLSDICRDNLVGRSYLQKIFREKTGGGAMEYFGVLKVEAAKQMIREGSHNFTEIAALLSYNSIHYFSRHFKKVTGMTPSEYASSVKILTAKGRKKP